MSTEQSREGRSSTAFTVVFDGDVRALTFNPHKAETQFGKVRSVGVGDAHAINDSMLAALEALQEQLECPVRNTNRGMAYREGVTISNDVRESIRAAIAAAVGDRPAAAATEVLT